MVEYVNASAKVRGRISWYDGMKRNDYLVSVVQLLIVFFFVDASGEIVVYDGQVDAGRPLQEVLVPQTDRPKAPQALRQTTVR